MSKADYDQALIQKVEHALATNERLRLYDEIARDFSGMSPGATWEDFRVGMQDLARWKRVAAITDIPWIRQMVHMFGFLMPAATKVFPLAEAAAARARLAHLLARIADHPASRLHESLPRHWPSGIKDRSLPA